MRGQTNAFGNPSEFLSITYTGTFSANASGSAALTASDMNMSTPSGYEPFALGGSYCSNANCVFRFINIYAVEDGRSACAFRNVATSSVSNVTAEITVIYKRV